ncbi:hypothetical protein [Bradyrhizobium sp. 27S5]|uniref:hypothetical protein n=1 Tax=Bradyrhizobium sp. 27S5 TaxID=3139728 RepID=UPI0030D5BE1B
MMRSGDLEGVGLRRQVHRSEIFGEGLREQVLRRERLVIRFVAWPNPAALMASAPGEWPASSRWRRRSRQTYPKSGLVPWLTALLLVADRCPADRFRRKLTRGRKSPGNAAWRRIFLFYRSLD